MPYVSVVLPTYNRLARLKKVIAGLENQTYPSSNFEVIVVSDGSTDGTNEYLQVVQSPLNLKPVFQSNQGVAATRNHGVDQASGEMILFIDDDVVPIPQLIIEHLKVHEQKGDNIIAIGPMLTPANFRLSPWVKWGQDRLIEQYTAMINGEWEPSPRQFYTGNASLSRHILTKYGGFDPNFRRAEDVELAYRLQKQGIRFVFCPEAVGYHYEERSFEAWLAIPYAYGRNDVIFTFQKEIPWLLSAIFEEYHSRHAITRFIVHTCLDNPGLSKFFTSSMKILLNMSELIRVNLLSRVACSSLFNLYYFQGIADELGGRQIVFNAIKGKTISSPYSK